MLALGIAVTVASSCATGSESAPADDDDDGTSSTSGTGGTASSAGGASSSSKSASSSSNGSTASSTASSSASVASVASSSGTLASSSTGMMCMPPPGLCDEFTCGFACFTCFSLGCCVNNACVCQDIMSDCPDTGAGGGGGA